MLMQAMHIGDNLTLPCHHRGISSAGGVVCSPGLSLDASRRSRLPHDCRTGQDYSAMEQASCDDLVRTLLLAQEERLHGGWLLQQPGGAIKRIVNGPFEAVESQAPSVRVHHQAERR